MVPQQWRGLSAQVRKEISYEDEDQTISDHQKTAWIV